MGVYGVKTTLRGSNEPKGLGSVDLGQEQVDRPFWFVDLQGGSVDQTCLVG